LPTVDDLPDGAAQGDLYVVETPAPATAWVWDEAEAAYVDGGPVQGPQGIQGEQGIPGVQGPAGNDGAPGSQGPAGADGAAGPTGPKGDTGAVGSKGDTGPAGPAGADGATGPAGPAGPTAVSADAGNTSKLGTDGLIFTPAASGGTGFLPTTGGEMTGAITLPSGTNGLVIKGTNYNLLGGSGGVAFRNNTSNIVNFSGGEVAAYVPITTAGAGVGVKFGSGGPTLSKSGTMIASSAPITVAAAPATDPELANKKYVDDKVAAGGGGSSVTNPVAGSAPGMVIWTGTQSAYDAVASKSSSTVYFITG